MEKKTLNRNFIYSIVALSLMASAVSAAPANAQGKKPAVKKPAAAAGAKKPAAAPAKKPSGPIVLGTTQLPGDFGQLGQTYTIGKSDPINFTLKSAEYSVVPLTVGLNTWVPKADQKLLVLRYTVHNPNPKVTNYGWHSLQFTAVDSKDTNHEYIQAVTREGLKEPLFIDLKPAQKVDVVAAIMVPAEGVVPKLIVQRERNAPVIRYDLRGKAQPLPAPMADPADTTGATALAEVPATFGTYYTTGAFDVKLDEVAYTAGPLIKREAGDGKRFMTATFTIKNRLTKPVGYYWSDFLPQLKDADGEKVLYTQAILKASRDETTQGELAPGEEARIRFFFPLPENVTGKTLRLTEGKIIDARVARAYAFDVSAAK